MRGGQKVLDLQFSHFVAPPLPIINDQSLMVTPQSLNTVGEGSVPYWWFMFAR